MEFARKLLAGRCPLLAMTLLVAALPTVLFVHFVLAAQMRADHGELLVSTLTCHDASPFLIWRSPLAVSVESAVVLMSEWKYTHTQTQATPLFSTVIVKC